MMRGRIVLLFFMLVASLANASDLPIPLPRVNLGSQDNGDTIVNECNERCGADGAGCTGEDGNVGVDICSKYLGVANSASDSIDDDNNCWWTWHSDGMCDSSQNNAECGYDGGDCCSCDCGREVTESEVNGTIYVETIYNGTVTLETTFLNGTTVVTTDVANETTTTWSCGSSFWPYACIDPSSSCVDDDDYTASDDDSVQCDSELWACLFDEECLECLGSTSSSSMDDEDDILDNCPLSSTSCAGYADYYCCALEASFGRECADNRHVVNYMDCVHTSVGLEDCGFTEFCAGAPAAGGANLALTAAFGTAVAGLVVATAVLF